MDCTAPIRVLNTRRTRTNYACVIESMGEAMCQVKHGHRVIYKWHGKTNNQTIHNSTKQFPACDGGDCAFWQWQRMVARPFPCACVRVVGPNSEHLHTHTHTRHRKCVSMSAGDAEQNVFIKLTPRHTNVNNLCALKVISFNETNAEISPVMFVHVMCCSGISE